MIQDGAVVFIDAMATSPYTLDTLAKRALGGTEATVLRVAQGLTSSHDVILAQSAQKSSENCGGIIHIPYDHKNPLQGLTPKAVVVVRGYKLLPRLRRQFPQTPLFLWLHCLPGTKRRHLASLLNETKTQLICVSDYQRQAVDLFMRGYEPKEARHVHSRRIYNPIPDDLIPSEESYDPDRLIFFSSPHKGIDQVFRAFQEVKKDWPKMKLYVANPGYLFRDHPKEVSDVINLGPLPHHEVLWHVQKAFCLFYPQSTFKETFGLVFAEANALGTPVIAHPIGSAREVLNPADTQLLDVENINLLLERIYEWKIKGRPHVFAKEEFRLKNVLKDWEQAFDSDPLHLQKPQGLVQDTKQDWIRQPTRSNRDNNQPMEIR